MGYQFVALLNEKKTRLRLLECENTRLRHELQSSHIELKEKREDADSHITEQKHCNRGMGSSDPSGIAEITQEVMSEGRAKRKAASKAIPATSQYLSNRFLSSSLNVSAYQKMIILFSNRHAHNLCLLTRFSAKKTRRGVMRKRNSNLKLASSASSDDEYIGDDEKLVGHSNATLKGDRHEPRKDPHERGIEYGEGSSNNETETIEFGDWSENS